jgi:hypothetical protein
VQVGDKFEAVGRSSAGGHGILEGVDGDFEQRANWFHGGLQRARKMANREMRAFPASR